MSNTVPVNNNTSLYNSEGNAIPVGNDVYANNINATGNLTVDGFILANGSITTNSNFVGELIGNVAANTVSATGNITSGGFFIGDGSQLTNLPSGNYSNANVAAYLPVYAGNILSNNIGVNSNITVSGQGIFLANVTATGNITGSYIIGNGSQLTGLPAGYSNADVAAYLPTYSGNLSAGNVSATGNITGNFFVGNGSQLTGLPASYSNANVQAYLPTYSGNLNPAFVSATGNVTAQNLKTSGVTGNIVGANYVSANFYLGDGGLLSNISGTNYSNANVAAFLANSFGSNAIVTTGNITAGTVTATGNVSASYFIGNGSQLTGLPSGYSNTDVNAHLAAFGSNTISTTGNITAGYFAGDGSLLSNITAGNITGTVANATFATTAGTANTANTATFATSAGTANTANTATFATTAGTANSATTANTATFATTAGTANTVTDAAQPNITSVGNLSGLTVAGNASVGNLATTGTITATGNITTAGYFVGNFAGNISGNLTVPGSNTQVIYNNNGNAGASGNFTFDFGNNVMSVSGNIAAGNVSASGNIAGNYIIGDGSQLTNLPIQPGTYSNSNVQAYLPTYNGNIGNINGAPLELNADQVHIHASNLTSNVNGISLNTPSGGSFVVMETPRVYIAEPTGGGGTRLEVAGNIITQPGNILVSGYVSASGNITAGNVSTAGKVFTPQVESSGDLDLNTTGQVNVNGNIRVGDNNTDTQIATHGAGDLIIRTHAGDAAQGNIRLYDGANGNIDITTNGTGVVNLVAPVSATGNITAPYFIGNGSQLTGLPAGYSNTDVNNHLAAFGSNTISTTGNITAGFFIGDGSQLTNLPIQPGTYSNANVANYLPTYSGTITATVVSATGNITGSYIIGNGSQLTGITATANAAGADGQIQFNSGNAFAGNTNMSFNSATGNITLGNLVVNSRTLITDAGLIDLANAQTFGTTTPWRVIIGNVYNGSANNIYNQTSAGSITSSMSNPRLLNADFVNVPNSNVRYSQGVNMSWVVLSANVSASLQRLSASRNEITMGGSTANYVYTNNTPFHVIGTSSQVYVGAGTNANASAVGNIISSGGVVGSFNGVQINLGSSANLAVATVNNISPASSSTANGTANTIIGALSYSPGAPANANATTTSAYVGFYQAGPSSTALAGWNQTQGNIARQANVYYAFRNDDDLAKSKLGMLDSFHELNANTATVSGNITISKANGQVQSIYPTGNITIDSFTNFITRVQRPNADQVNTADTVTLIIQQGATPYTLTMPTGNTNIRYAGNISSVDNTANSTTMISITGVYDYNTSSNQYLITISPEFV